MTREEANKNLYDDWYIENGRLCVDGDKKDAFLEAVGMGIKALRPVSREQVEKIYPGCDECKPSCGICINTWGWDGYHKPQVCEDCKECSNFEADDNYCYNCGRPLTDEAVEMVMERINKMEGTENG